MTSFSVKERLVWVTRQLKFELSKTCCRHGMIKKVQIQLQSLTKFTILIILLNLFFLEQDRGKVEHQRSMPKDE